MIAFLLKERGKNWYSITDAAHVACRSSEAFPGRPSTRLRSREPEGARGKIRRKESRQDSTLENLVEQIARGGVSGRLDEAWRSKEVQRTEI